MMQSKIIKGFSNYRIYEDGRVQNRFTRYFLKASPNGSGYLHIQLSKNNEGTMKKIHTLVAEAFIIKPENKNYIDHIDHDILNNSIDNLRWVTLSENSRNQSICSNNTS